MSGFGIFAPDSGLPGRQSRKGVGSSHGGGGGGVLSNAGARVAGGGGAPRAGINNPLSWGQNEGYGTTYAVGSGAMHAGGGGAHGQDDFPPAAGTYATQHESQQQLALHMAVQKNKQQMAVAAQAQAQFPPPPQAQVSAQAQAQAKPAGSSIGTTNNQTYGLYAAAMKPPVAAKPAVGYNPVNGMNKGAEVDSRTFQSEASRQYQGMQQQPQQQPQPQPQYAPAPQVQAAGAPSSFAAGRQSSHGRPTDAPAAGAPSAYNARDGHRGIGTAQAMGFGGGERFAAQTTAQAQFGGSSSSAAAAGGAPKHQSSGSGDLQNDAAQAMLKQTAHRKTPVPQGLNGINNAKSTQQQRYAQAAATPLNPDEYYHPDHPIYSKKHPQNRQIKGTFNILNNAQNDGDGQRLAQATFRTTNMADFTDKGYAARKPAASVHPSASSLGVGQDAHFDGKTTAHESYPQYKGARPSTPADAPKGGGTDAVFHPPGAAPSKWDTESHQQFDKSKLAGASPSKPVFDRSSQQLTHLSYYDANAKFDSSTTSSGAYHTHSGAKPSAPFKPRTEEGGDTILHHGAASAADIERFQTENHSRYQHGRAYVKSRTASGAAVDPANAYSGAAAGAPSLYARNTATAQQQSQSNASAAQKSNVFATGPAAGGADLPFSGQQARAAYQNNSTAFAAATAGQAMPSQQQYQSHSMANYQAPQGYPQAQAPGFPQAQYQGQAQVQYNAGAGAGDDGDYDQ